MQQHETQQANVEDEQDHSGGAAPEHRQCRYTKADGKGCRDWAIRGQELCYRHGVFVHSGRNIDVPLLEDEASIVLVLSETLRAVALGTVSVNTGRLLMDGCRLAHTMQMEKQKAANLERSRRRKEAREQEMAEQDMAEQPMVQEEICQEEFAQEEMSEESSVPDHEPDAPSSEICALLSKPCEDPRYEEIHDAALAAQAEPMEEELAVAMR